MYVEYDLSMSFSKRISLLSLVANGPETWRSILWVVFVMVTVGMTGVSFAVAPLTSTSGTRLCYQRSSRAPTLYLGSARGSHLPSAPKSSRAVCSAWGVLLPDHYTGVWGWRVSGRGRASRLRRRRFFIGSLLLR